MKRSRQRQTEVLDLPVRCMIIDAEPVCTQQDDLSSPHLLLRHIAIPHERLQTGTRNGYDWSSRYPRIVEAALRHRPGSFVLDGEAVLLGVDGIADFNGLHSRKHDDEASSTPSTS